MACQSRMPPLCNIHYKVEIYGNQDKVSTTSAEADPDRLTWQLAIVLYPRSQFSKWRKPRRKGYCHSIPESFPLDQNLSLLLQRQPARPLILPPVRHGAGRRGPGRATRPANPSVDMRRPADETRLPPAGSFRSGLYRLLRALLINQGVSSYKENGDRDGSRKGEALPAGAGLQPASSLPGAPADDPTEDPARRQRLCTESIPGGPPNPLKASAYWLSRALMVRPLAERPEW